MMLIFFCFTMHCVCKNNYVTNSLQSLFAVILFSRKAPEFDKIAWLQVLVGTLVPIFISVWDPIAYISLDLHFEFELSLHPNRNWTFQNNLSSIKPWIKTSFQFFPKYLNSIVYDTCSQVKGLFVSKKQKCSKLWSKLYCNNIAVPLQGLPKVHLPILFKLDYFFSHPNSLDKKKPLNWFIWQKFLLKFYRKVLPLGRSITWLVLPQKLFKVANFVKKHVLCTWTGSINYLHCQLLNFAKISQWKRHGLDLSADFKYVADISWKYV